MSEELTAKARRCLIAIDHLNEGEWWDEDVKFGWLTFEDDVSELAKHYLSPPAAGPGFDAEGDLPVTEEWLRVVGKDIGRLEFRIGDPSKSINIDGLGICLPPDMRSWEYCGHPIKTRGQVRLLCLALGIPLPPAPNESIGGK